MVTLHLVQQAHAHNTAETVAGIRLRPRCHWCGVFVRTDTEPTWGADRWGVPLAQLLCPEDAAFWADVLTVANLERIHTETEPAP